MTENNRYARQIILPEFGTAGQVALSRASVLCVGAGGLGCPALQYLAGAGVGHIGIIDGDTVEESNLHRQVLFTMGDIGRNKAEAAKDRILSLNPYITVTVYPEELNADNAETLFCDYDIVIDGTDNFTAKFLINDVGRKTATPVVFASVLGFEGQVALFDHAREDAPCYRCLYPHPPRLHIPNCAEAGVIGAVAGMAGTMQALETIKYLAGNPARLPYKSGILTCIDTRSMRFRHLSLSKADGCVTCGVPRPAVQIDTPDNPDNRKESVCPMSQPPHYNIHEISPEDVRAFPKPFRLIDVREQDEWDAGHIDGAEFFPLSRLMAGDSLPHDTGDTLVLYCRSGKRSLTAGQILQSRGYQDIYNMTGGILAWD